MPAAPRPAPDPTPLKAATPPSEPIPRAVRTTRVEPRIALSCRSPSVVFDVRQPICASPVPTRWIPWDCPLHSAAPRTFRRGALSYVLLLGALALTGELDERAVGEVLLRTDKGERVLRTLLGHVDEHDLTGTQFAEKDLLGEAVLDVPLEGSAQRPRAEDRVETAFGDERLGGRRELD